MRGFSRFILGVGMICSYLIFLISLTLTLQYLTPSFYIKNLQKPYVYDYIEKALKTSAGNALRDEVKKQGINIDTLTTGQRAQIEAQIDSILTPITKENIQDFCENNIVNILSYVNGERNQFLIYLPLAKWGIKEDAISQLPEYLQTENVDLLTLTKEGKINMPLDKIQMYKNLGLYIKISLIASFLSMSLIFILHVVLGKGPQRYEQSATYLLVCGILTLVGAWIFNVTSQTISSGLSLKQDPMAILVGAIAPALLSETMKLWVAIGAGTILISFFSTYAVSNLNENRKKPQSGLETPGTV